MFLVLSNGYSLPAKGFPPYLFAHTVWHMCAPWVPPYFLPTQCDIHVLCGYSLTLPTKHCIFPCGYSSFRQIAQALEILESVVGKCLVCLCHFVHIFFFLYRSACIVCGIHNLICQPILHGLFAPLTGIGDKPTNR